MRGRRASSSPASCTLRGREARGRGAVVRGERCPCLLLSPLLSAASQPPQRTPAQVCEVQLAEGDVALQLLGHLAAGVGPAAAQHHVRARGGQSCDRLFAESAVASSHDCRLALEVEAPQGLGGGRAVAQLGVHSALDRRSAGGRSAAVGGLQAAGGESHSAASRASPARLGREGAPHVPREGAPHVPSATLASCEAGLR